MAAATPVLPLPAKVRLALVPVIVAATGKVMVPPAESNCVAAVPSATAPVYDCRPVVLTPPPLTVVVPVTVRLPSPVVVPLITALPVTLSPKAPLVRPARVTVLAVSLLLAVSVRLFWYVCVPVVVKLPPALMALAAVKFFTPVMLLGSVNGVLRFRVRSLVAPRMPLPSVRLVPARLEVPPSVTTPE